MPTTPSQPSFPPTEKQKTPVSTKPKKANANEVKITKNYRIAADTFTFIPYESAELYKIIPLMQKGNTLHVGAVDPSSVSARDALNFITISQGLVYELQKITEDQFSYLIQQYNQSRTSMDATLKEIEGEQDVVLGIEEDPNENVEGVIREEAPIIKLVSTILSQAVSNNVSDIHIEAYETYSLVRYRVDGVLQEQLKFARKIHEPLVARIKILSNLRLDERRRPQDGRFSSIIQKNRVDFRVATFPTSSGEKVVLRVLDKEKGLRSLSDLGFEEATYQKVLNAIHRPYGLILATGPTGAGKTTTLYALLSMLERKSKNIVSLEDPVEYRLDGINQSNIRPEIGYTFATGLRSVLRGDPDQIFVGEIRDHETAQLAVQAALTGHVVYSTLHTNTAIGAVSRLLNFGIDPFLLAPVLSLVIGQRMVRKIDGESKDLPIGQGMLKHLEQQFLDLPQRYKSQIPDFTSFKDAVSTDENPSGMRGRVGVFEAFEIDEDIRSIILSNPVESEMYASVRNKGFISMEEAAIIKGLRGIIPISEVVKVGSENILNESRMKDISGTAEETSGL